MRITAGLSLLALLLAESAYAVDGVLEINQACIIPGCFAGDPGGFPVQIISPGSYRLTSNLTPANQNTTLILITTHGVSLDLNGFAIQGTNTFFGTSCSAPGSGVGVRSTVHSVAVSNGAVRGMGSGGLALDDISRVDRVVAEHNCGTGISVGNTSLVTNSEASYNGSFGFDMDQVSRISNCTAIVNGLAGIHSNESGIGIDGCVSSTNGGSGIELDISLTRLGAVVVNSAARFNDVHGIVAGNGAGTGNLFLRSSFSANTQYGIRFTEGGFGFINSANNATNIGPGARLACNVDGTTVNCP